MIVLDGVIFDGSLNEINTQDIASFDILMDASAAAIYGSRAANGVIMISTKRGKTGKPAISVNNNYGTQSWTKRPDMRKGADFIKWRTENRRLAGQADLSLEKVLDAKEVIAYNNGQEMDWLKEITQYAPLNDLNLSVSGRTDMVNYYVSAGYLKQNGVLDNDNFKKYTVTAKMDAKINKWLESITDPEIRQLAEEQDAPPRYEAEIGILRECLQKLPEKSRELVQLYYYHDVATPEIAGQMEMKADTVCRALSRVREKLRECIQSQIKKGGPAYA